jgi:hypothetical protein
LSSGWRELSRVLTLSVIGYHYNVVEVRRVGLNFVIYSGSVCAYCMLGLSVNAEFLIDNDICIDIKFISWCREFEIGRATKLSSERSI